MQAYIAITVVFTILLLLSGFLPNRFGFGLRLDLRQVILVPIAIVVLRALNCWIFDLLIEELCGARELSRFTGVENSTASLAGLLITSWIFFLHSARN